MVQIKFPLSPTTGVHLFNPGLAVNPLNGIVGLDYESTTNFNPANLTVPLQFTQQIAGFDPFFLPELIGNPVIAISDIIPPTRQTFFLPNILANGKVDTEVVDNFVSQDAGGNDVVNQTIITGGNNDNTLNIPLPTIVESVGQSVIYNLRSSFRQDNSTTVGTTTLPYLSNYDLAWDQYSSASQVFKINFQIFDATGAATSSVITPVSLSNVADISLAPAWNFGSGGAGSSYLLEVAQSDSTLNAALNLTGLHDELHFQGYNLNGSQSSLSFNLQPDLHLYAPGATNHITQEVLPTLSSFAASTLAYSPYPLAGEGYAIAWNETVTDAYGTHDQVEFATFGPLTTISNKRSFRLEMTLNKMFA